MVNEYNIGTGYSGAGHNPGQQPYKAPESNPKKNRLKALRSGLSTLGLFLLAPVIAILITSFCFQSYQVDGASMETTLQNNDRLIVNKIGVSWSKLTNHNFVPHRGDIIIFEQTGLYDSQGNQERQLIKRVIGLPGERVVVKDGSVKVYNSEYPDGFNPDTAGNYEIEISKTEGTEDETLKEGEIYVLGDNRSNSADSRIFGPVSTQDVIGKLSLRILPISSAEKF